MLTPLMPEAVVLRTVLMTGNLFVRNFNVLLHRSGCFSGVDAKEVFYHTEYDLVACDTCYTISSSIISFATISILLASGHALQVQIKTAVESALHMSLSVLAQLGTCKDTRSQESMRFGRSHGNQELIMIWQIYRDAKVCRFSEFLESK